MKTKQSFFEKSIAWFFYLLFFSVPLILSSKTSELFEFNKMWLTFGIAIVIASLWGSRMIVEKRFFIRRTPLDIPLLLFLGSQFISTIISWDRHISLWGYYSRFNGGFLSLLTYVFLFYAFVTNMRKKDVFGTVIASLLSGICVAIWGIPSHFGHDPTCLVFRGTFDTSCWTDAFKPTIRAFSTLGQPAWLAAYASVLVPIALIFGVKNTEVSETKKKSSFWSPRIIGSVILAFIFYLCLIFSDTRGGFLGFWAANVIFWALLYLKKLFSREQFMSYFLLVNSGFLVLTFMFGSPIPQLQKYSLQHLTEHPATPNTTQQAVTQPQTTPVSPGDLGGTDSGKIRLFVWKGALDAWRAHPIIGTGVETFAFAYYLYRPVGHNMTSEWDYLYNKAHNEYLNYLATTGILGLGTYLFFIAAFFFFTYKILFREKHQATDIRSMTIGMLSAFISILISNFFGFSVVIINLYLFLIPAFVFIFSLDEEIPAPLPQAKTKPQTINLYQSSLIAVIFLIALFLLYTLNRYWRADIAYSLGSNLDHAGEYQQAYDSLNQAVTLRKTEPIFSDELSYNQSVLAAAFANQKDATTAGTLAKQAIDTSDTLTSEYPYNIVFWKNRVRIFYNLSQVNPEFMPQAVAAIKKVHDLAPTDAKVMYNLGVLTGQSGDVVNGINYLQQTIQLKPDYRDAYFALGLFYHDQAVDKNNKVIHPDLEQKAVSAMQYILTKLVPNDPEVLKTLKSWNE